jgi:RNA polymerase sigma-70 factor (ECF subfamily)
VPPDGDITDVRAAREGDPDAFAALVRRHGRRVHDVARRMLRDEGEAEDVTQQAFLNAWRALERFDETRPFRNWILRIATNLCRNRFAARRRRPGERGRGGDDPLPAGGTEPAELPLPPSTRGRLREAVASLPEHYRLAVVLHHVHGLLLEDVSEIAAIPVATVKTHLFRARALLRRMLLEEGETGGPGGGTEE